MRNESRIVQYQLQLGRIVKNRSIFVKVKTRGHTLERIFSLVYYVREDSSLSLLYAQKEIKSAACYCCLDYYTSSFFPFPLVDMKASYCIEGRIHNHKLMDTILVMGSANIRHNNENEKRFFFLLSSSYFAFYA